MRNGTPRLAVAWALVALGAPAVSAQSDEFPTLHYRLLDESTYQHGCFEPCDCPILEPVPLEGRFDLVFFPFGGPVETKGVTEVRWSVPALDLEITGSGIHQLVGDQQRLALDLQIDGEPVQQFDSGLVPGGDEFPLIDVVITLNQFFCYDVVMHVRAAPISSFDLDLVVDESGLSWSGMPETTSFDVVGGDLGYLASSGGDFTAATDSCLADDRSVPSLDHAIPLSAGQGIWFLVRGAHESADAPYDSRGASQRGARDAEVDASALACP